jgi:hypothetical protein
MRTTDAFVHAWHLAKATGSPPTWTVPATPLLASLCQHMTGGLRGVYFGDRNLVIGTGRLSATAQIVAICAPQLLSASGPLAAQIGGSVRVLLDHQYHSA